MCISISCACARNCMHPPTIICAITFWPFRVGCDLPYLISALCILSIISSQGVDAFVLFPSHTPRILITSWSLGIFILSSSGAYSFSFSFLVVVIFRRWSCFLIGIISVFSMLNLASDVLHHSFSMVWTCSILSSLLRKRLVSSAYKFIITFSSIPGISSPFIFSLLLILQVSGSIARLNRAHDRGSPCCTFLVTLHGLLRIPFTATLVCACLCSPLTVSVKVLGTLNCSRVSYK